MDVRAVCVSRTLGSAGVLLAQVVLNTDKLAPEQAIATLVAATGR